MLRTSHETLAPVCFAAALSALAGCKCAETKPAEPIKVEKNERAAQREADLAVLPRAAGTLVDQLAAEAAARQPDAPSLEKLTASLSAQSVTLGPSRQVLGNKQLAIYCASADSSDGVLVTVCEYPSDAQAERGEADANVVQSQIAGHQSARNKKSVLHVVARSDTPAATVDKVLSAFKSL